MYKKEQLKTLFTVSGLFLVIEIFALIAMRSESTLFLVQLVLGGLIVLPIALFLTYRIKGQRALAQRPPFIREAGWYRKPGEGAEEAAAPKQADGEDKGSGAETGLEKDNPETDDEKEKAVALAKAKAAAAAKAKAAAAAKAKTAAALKGDVAAAAKSTEQPPGESPEEEGKPADADEQKTPDKEGTSGAERS